MRHHVTEEKAGIPTRHFRQLRKMVSAGESHSLWRVLWASVTLQTVKERRVEEGKKSEERKEE